MLVLSRKKDQTVVIEGGIEIQILQLKGGTVKLGINAPRDIRIVRGELEVYPDLVPAEASKPKALSNDGASDAAVELEFLRNFDSETESSVDSETEGQPLMEARAGYAVPQRGLVSKVVAR